METTHQARAAAPTSSLDPARIAARVRREHATIRTLLDDVERACALSQGPASGGDRGNASRLRRVVWELYLVFDEHLAMEEAHVAPILRERGGEPRAVAMILEHNEQRRLILELVEDAERDEKPAADVVAEALSLVGAFRTDMDLEESALATVFASAV